jgi:hypothetical protein
MLSYFTLPNSNHEDKGSPIGKCRFRLAIVLNTIRKRRCACRRGREVPVPAGSDLGTAFGRHLRLSVSLEFKPRTGMSAT